MVIVFLSMCFFPLNFLRVDFKVPCCSSGQSYYLPGVVTGGGIVILGELLRQVINANARKPWTADGSTDFRWGSAGLPARGGLVESLEGRVKLHDRSHRSSIWGRSSIG
jgi:hypothetical protein